MNAWCIWVARKLEAIDVSLRDELLVGEILHSAGVPNHYRLLAGHFNRSSRITRSDTNYQHQRCPCQPLPRPCMSVIRAKVGIALTYRGVCYGLVVAHSFQTHAAFLQFRWNETV
jgi:hypothetical protein